MGEFLKDLPCHDQYNFQALEYSSRTSSSITGRQSNSMKRPPIFIQTKEYPEEQVVITTEKTNILLRHLQQQLDKRNKKREVAKGDDSDNSPRNRKYVKLK